MNKRINIAITILCIVETICCFTPFCLDEEYWKYLESSVYHGASALQRHNGISIFEIREIWGKRLSILFICTAIVVVVISFIKMLRVAVKIADRAWIFAIAHTATMGIFLLYSCVFARFDLIVCRYEYGVNWMSYIIIALNLIILTLSILLKMDKTAELHIKKKGVAEKEQTESIDDLLVYKELLDSGVISQEEFDEKKRQLLDL